MRITVVAAALAATFAAAPAYAQLSGPRIEARLGWDNLAADVEILGPGEILEFERDASTIGYGAEVGYDAALGMGVVGVYGGIDFTEADVCDELFGEDEVCLSARRNLTLGVRGGIAPTPATLLYVKGGYSNGRVRATYEDFEDILDGIDESDSRGGYHVGVGGELAFGTSTYAKVEYVHTKYKDFDIGAGATGGFSRNQLLAGIGLRF